MTPTLIIAIVFASLLIIGGIILAILSNRDNDGYGVTVIIVVCTLAIAYILVALSLALARL